MVAQVLAWLAGSSRTDGATCRTIWSETDYHYDPKGQSSVSAGMPVGVMCKRGKEMSHKHTAKCCRIEQV